MCFVSKSIILIYIVVICTTDPTGESYPGIAGDTIWANLPIVVDIFYLHLTVVLTLGCGMASLIVDMFYNKHGYRAVFHEYWDEFTSIPCVCCGIMWCCRSHQLKEEDGENVSIQLESKAVQHEQQADGNNSQTLELPELP